MARRKTNTQFLRDLMDYSRAGPLMQAFVLEAIAKYADQCASADPRVFDSGLLNGDAWHRCAVEAKNALAAHLAS